MGSVSYFTGVSETHTTRNRTETMKLKIGTLTTTNPVYSHMMALARAVYGASVLFAGQDGKLAYFVTPGSRYLQTLPLADFMIGPVN